MNQNQVLVLVVVVVVIVFAAIFLLRMRKTRSMKLRERFGPEYDRVLQQEGDSHKAEGILEFREKRREQFRIRPLSVTDRSSFATRWSEVQARFVDNPPGAVAFADSLVTDVMRVRGYPIGEFEQQAADISVDYPMIVENYRSAHAIAMRHNIGGASTEDLRKAMVHYRALFQDLLDEPKDQRKEA